SEGKLSRSPYAGTPQCRRSSARQRAWSNSAAPCCPPAPRFCFSLPPLTETPADGINPNDSTSPVKRVVTSALGLESISASARWWQGWRPELYWRHFCRVSPRLGWRALRCDDSTTRSTHSLACLSRSIRSECNGASQLAE